MAIVANGSEIYYKVRDVVRQQGHSETESCRVFKDWHIELRVGSGHVSVWTSQGLVYLTMLDKPVHYRQGVWEEHLARLHMGRPILKPPADLRELLRTQALESDEEEVEAGEPRKVVSREDGSSNRAAADPNPAGSEGFPSPTSADVDDATRDAECSISLEAEDQPATNTEPSQVLASAADLETDVAVATDRDTPVDPSSYVFGEEVVLIDEDDIDD